MNDSYLGAGYGIVGDLEREAVGLMAQTEGILLDPVYTGRAFGGLLDLLRSLLIRLPGPIDLARATSSSGTPAASRRCSRTAGELI